MWSEVERSDLPSSDNADAAEVPRVKLTRSRVMGVDGVQNGPSSKTDAENGSGG